MAEVKKLPEADKIFEIPISYEEKGKEIGREEGKKEGKIEGKREGKKEGEAIAMKKVAMEMLKKGLNIDLIADVTHLDIEEIKNLKEQI